MVKRFMLVFLLAVIVYLVPQAAYSGYYLRKAGILTKTEYTQNLKLGDKGKPTLKVFMSGDSIAAGVGASSFETSTAGRLASFLAMKNKLTFINEAKSGTRMAELLNLPLPPEKQNLIILIVSSNDVFHFTNLNEFDESAKRVLEKYSKLTDKMILLGPGRVSTAPALPLPLRWVYKIREQKYADAMAKSAEKYSNIVYIKPGVPQKGTFAPDKFHPNNEGHKVWFEAIKSAI